MSESKSRYLPDSEDVLNNEKDLLQGLIEAGNFRDDESLRRKVDICHKGKLLFSFTVRPLNEEEEKICNDKATPRFANPGGRKLPKLRGETDWVKFRSWKIYLATIKEDRELIWDNPTFKKQFDVLHGVDMIDAVLRIGDKDKICAVIEEISGADLDEEPDTDEKPTLEEYAKN